MNFLTNSEDVYIVGAILGALEFEEPNKLRLGESTHEILDLIKFSNVSSSESSTEEAILCGAGPSVLMRAIPNGVGKCRVA